MFAQPAALLFFVAKELTDRKPFEWFAELALVCRDDAREGRGELRPECHFALAFIGEIKKLRDDFGAALFLVKVGRLKNRPVPFDETVATTDFAPASEN